MIGIESVRKWRDGLAAAAIAAGTESFMGKPTAWFEDIHWFCPNGHVSGRMLKCEEDGDRCLACHAPVLMGPAIGEREFGEVLRLISP